MIIYNYHLLENIFYYYYFTPVENYLNPIAACQTNANNRKKTGTIGNISTIVLKIKYASSNLAKSKLSMINPYNYKKLILLNSKYLIILILL